jgi:hypothetical protein
MAEERARAAAALREADWARTELEGRLAGEEKRTAETARRFEAALRSAGEALEEERSSAEAAKDAAARLVRPRPLDAGGAGPACLRGAACA